jgi:hypothetical protein
MWMRRGNDVAKDAARGSGPAVLGLDDPVKLGSL